MIPNTVAPHCLRQCGVLLAALLATAVFITPPVAAVTYVLPSDESMVDRTSMIVFGRVLSAATAPENLRLPATDFTVEVEEVLKGEIASGTIVVRQLGGVRPNGLAMRIGGLPMLREGESVLLFLSEREGVFRTVDFALGIFFEVQVQGRTLLEREPSLRENVLGLGQDERADPEALLGLRDGEGFRRWVRDRAAGVERPKDYFVPESEVVRGPATVVSPYRFLRTSQDCEYPDWSMRWTKFEQNNFVAFRIQNVGRQPVVGSTREDVLREIGQAMTAWNQDGQSRVDLRYYTESFDVPAEGSEYRGENFILWNDPFDQQPGELGPDGGVLAWAAGWSECNSTPVPRPPPYQRYSDVRIAQVDITTRKGLRTWLWQQDSRDWAMRRNFQEIMAHELGHGLGFGHPCGDDESGECRTEAEREAIMYARARADERGARLSSDDQAILRRLYPVPASPRPPQAPTDVRVVPTNNETARVTWLDRSFDEEGFVVWNRLQGAGWETAVRTVADVEEAYVYGLRPGGRYDFLVRAYRGDLYADSDRVTVTMPDSTTRPGTLQNSQFGVSFRANANGSTVVGRAADWTSDKGVLYWLFDSQNPEALAKVLDGRSVNGHWWLDLAVTSDLHTATRVTHRGIGDEWVAVTGLGKDVFTEPGEAANRLVHCVFPASRADSRCAVSGYGTTVSLRDAWESSGRIPSKYFGVASASVNRDQVEAGALQGLFSRASELNVSADPTDDHLVPVRLSSVAAAASTLQRSQFGVSFSAKAHDSTVVGRSAGWPSDKGVLYWLFDSENPEALAKVLDGRNTNGHWWLDLAVTSDLHSITRITHRSTGEEWVAITGLGRDVFTDPRGTADRLVHCAYPASRADNRCAFWGYGTTISLRDAWDSSGRIPSIHYD